MQPPRPAVLPRPAHWPHRADPPGRYWGSYERYQRRGGLVRLEEDIKGLADGKPCSDVGRFFFFSLAFDQLMKEGIQGDIAELGVYKGGTASVLALMARRMGTTAWILDTFEGFDASDLQRMDAVRRAEFADTSLEAVKARVGEENTRFIKGHFPASAAQMPDDLRFALVHIDCDLYVPIMHALEYFYPRLMTGGYLIVHDYASLAWDGAEQAVDDFFADKPEPVIPLPDGGGSAVIRKARGAGTGEDWVLRKKCGLFTRDWTEAGYDRLLPLLVEGWSGGETWGVWGVGPAHVLDLFVDRSPRDSPVRLEALVGTVLAGARETQAVDVLGGGVVLTTWNFDLKMNIGFRAADIPPSCFSPVGKGGATVRLEFRPRDLRSPCELDPSKADTRVLGIGLHRIRRAT